MDKDRLKLICSKILNKKKITISNFNCIETYNLGDDGKWVQESYCVFLSINDNNEQKYLQSIISKELENIFGFEFIIEH